jgi:8-oxo-dGTP pyrophosphatase MutT (NUDIX family)
MSERIKTTPASFVFVYRTTPDHRQEVLLNVRGNPDRFEYGHWDVASGHPEYVKLESQEQEVLETPQEAGARELQEEYGLTAPLNGFELFQIHTYSGLPLYSYSFFRVNYAACSGRIKTSEPDVIKDLSWHDLSALPDKLSTGVSFGAANILSRTVVFTRSC